jgi:hypothetical protein
MGGVNEDTSPEVIRAGFVSLKFVQRNGYRDRLSEITCRHGGAAHP